MGQKVHPTGIRLGIATDWASKWYANTKNFPDLLETDLKVRQFLKEKLANASVSRIQIERPAQLARITIHTARPGIVIGKKGEDIEALRRSVARMMGLELKNLQINIEEIRKPELDAQLVAEGVAQQLERRIMFRRAMKRSVTSSSRPSYFCCSWAAFSSRWERISCRTFCRSSRRWDSWMALRTERTLSMRYRPKRNEATGMV